LELITRELTTVVLAEQERLNSRLLDQLNRLNRRVAWIEEFLCESTYAFDKSVPLMDTVSALVGQEVSIVSSSCNSRALAMQERLRSLEASFTKQVDQLLELISAGPTTPGNSSLQASAAANRAGLVEELRPVVIEELRKHAPLLGQAGGQDLASGLHSLESDVGKLKEGAKLLSKAVLRVTRMQEKSYDRSCAELDAIRQEFARRTDELADSVSSCIEMVRACLRGAGALL